MSKQSPIFVKTEVFMAWLFDHTRKFARHERFRLATRIDDALFDFHECFLRAAQKQPTTRAEPRNRQTLRLCQSPESLQPVTAR
jgi:hypothetical protein